MANIVLADAEVVELWHEGKLDESYLLGEAINALKSLFRA